VVSKFQVPKTQFESQSETKLVIKLIWIEKMVVLSIFLESSLNFLSNNLRKPYKM